jgi:hypothetical protein
MDTDDVMEAMKRGYKVSIGGSFFAGSGSSGNGTGNGLVVPSSSHKQEVAGSIPAG